MNVKPILLLTLALFTITANAQRKPRIKGNRDVIEVRQPLAAYRAVTLLDDLDITLERASEPGYVIEADDNLIDVLKFDVRSDTLYISSFYTITAKKKLEIRVQFNQLDGISLNEGRVECKDIINSESLSIKTSGMSKLQLNARTTHLNLLMDGQSKGEFNLDSDSLQVELKDRADARIYQVTNQLGLNMNGNSDASLEGTTTAMTLTMDASADLKAERTEAIAITAYLGGSAEAHLRTSGNLELNSRGAASTYLYGDGEISITEFLDTSKLYKRTD